ncbi:hypothetical protein [Kitasatospora sp. SolWspMP-SS2h]|uniref:hypothetical protein n=1 Tax=Kitasatospora sp. SolWspMP-SS2h TaxID=1305729 RepID=UPI00351A1DA1
MCASGISPAGPVHLGNLREIVVPHSVTDELRRRGPDCRHLLSWTSRWRARTGPGRDSTAPRSGCAPTSRRRTAPRCAPSPTRSGRPGWPRTNGRRSSSWWRAWTRTGPSPGRPRRCTASRSRGPGCRWTPRHHRSRRRPGASCSPCSTNSWSAATPAPGCPPCCRPRTRTASGRRRPPASPAARHEDRRTGPGACREGATTAGRSVHGRETPEPGDGPPVRRSGCSPACSPETGAGGSP